MERLEIEMGLRTEFLKGNDKEKAYHVLGTIGFVSGTSEISPENW